MNINNDIQEADFRLMLADFGEPIEWTQTGLSGTHELTAIVDDGPPHRVPHDRGPEPLIDRIFNVLIEDLPAGYNTQTGRIAYDGATYSAMNSHTEGIILTLETRRL